MTTWFMFLWLCWEELRALSWMQGKIIAAVKYWKKSIVLCQDWLFLISNRNHNLSPNLTKCFIKLYLTKHGPQVRKPFVSAVLVFVGRDCKPPPDVQSNKKITKSWTGKKGFHWTSKKQLRSLSRYIWWSKLVIKKYNSQNASLALIITFADWSLILVPNRTE